MWFLLVTGMESLQRPGKVTLQAWPRRNLCDLPRLVHRLVRPASDFSGTISRQSDQASYG
ncbi:hypothetical protein I7I48_10055 [Histoplasma ohiense]|nr:hypothetical protein I7I48_10055 [Histoplasma ohiense (nom. inval.)]